MNGVLVVAAAGATAGASWPAQVSRFVVPLGDPTGALSRNAERPVLATPGHR